ncbi:unnamed protein product, partial [Prunus brigantina]
CALYVHAHLHLVRGLLEAHWLRSHGNSGVKRVGARAIPRWVTYWEVARELPETKPGGLKADNIMPWRSRSRDGSSEWGFRSFMPCSELYDYSAGYFVNDICIVEAKVDIPIKIQRQRTTLAVAEVDLQVAKVDLAKVEENFNGIDMDSEMAGVAQLARPMTGPSAKRNEGGFIFAQERYGPIDN